MKINVSELKKFKANAAAIKTNPILPILAYLKFDKGTITKNSMSSFVIQRTECKESFLIDERILMNFINYTSAPVIDIKVTDKNITITDGSTTVKSPTEPIDNFPSNDESDDKPVKIDNEILESINIAVNFTTEEDIPSPKGHVFLGKKCVCSSNGFVAYVDEFEEELPEIVLKRETALAVGKLTDIKFSQNESYHFFDTADCKFGFIKSDYPFYDMTPFGNFEKGESFIINKTDFINVNEMVIGSTNAKLTIANIEVVDNKMIYEMNDADYEINIVKQIPVDGSATGKFSFNTAHMSRLLKSIPDTDLTFNKVGERYYVTGDSGFVALIIGLVIA